MNEKSSELRVVPTWLEWKGLSSNESEFESASWPSPATKASVGRLRAIKSRIEAYEARHLRHPGANLSPADRRLPGLPS
jgi:hypothetical protein